MEPIEILSILILVGVLAAIALLALGKIVAKAAKK